MAKYTAEQELAISTQGFKKDKLKSDYDTYLEQLATQYGLSKEALNSNLESRGILRSGEAGTARTRLAATNKANTTNARSDYVYNRDASGIDLQRELAAMQSGKATPAATAPQKTAAVPDPVIPPIAVAPTNIGNGMTYSNTGVYGAVYPTTAKPVKPKPAYDSRPSMAKPATTTFRPVGPRFR